MNSLFARRFPARRNPAGLLLSLVSAVVLLASGAAAHAQLAGAPTTPVHDASALKPPAGARVAIVEFEDMECPDCARANPLLKEAAEKYNIPWVRHDFPLSFHIWSTQAAINARWFDTRSKKLGDDYRDAVFASQTSIYNLNILNQFTQRFAQQHGVALPFAIDPQGKLAAEVKADYALGQRIGIEHTPTIWVVTNGGKAAPFIEIVDRTKLFQVIDQALAQTRSEAPARSAHR